MRARRDVLKCIAYASSPAEACFFPNPPLRGLRRHEASSERKGSTCTSRCSIEESRKLSGGADPMTFGTSIFLAEYSIDLQTTE